ncbi:hypothetical protein CK516_40055 [Nostoc sp. 'Peltigera malacea cyanobiont' DB3992]|nr:HAD family hydrolase [Nostoc sp. 'Peltigera malacea cyanobiont' DB3992]PHM05601.1 hypothetical protein CK516_40055 [Nostoc sp. 'Peltigera malacea cyanobiont' DB3992]
MSDVILLFLAEYIVSLAMKTVLFDLDDTLIRHEAAIRGASEELFAQVLPGRSQDCNVFVEKWISANASWYRKFYNGQVSFQESGRGKLRESFSEYGCVFSDRTADALLLEYWERYVGLCQLFDDVLECLGELDEYKVGVITNGQEAQQINKLKRCGIFQNSMSLSHPREQERRNHRQRYLYTRVRSLENLHQIASTLEIT